MITTSIVYISSEFNSKNGANKSASDVLYSLLRSFDTVHVISYSGKHQLNRSLFNRELKTRLRWTKVKRGVAFPGYKHPKEFLKWIYRTFEDIFSKDCASLAIDADLAVVNSLGGHSILTQIVGLEGVVKLNIFRGSPESFSHSSVGITVDDVLNILKRYDYLVFVSEIVRKKWTEFIEIQRIKNYYIPNCCEEELIKTIKSKPKKHYKAKLGLDSKGATIIYIASIQHRKGHDILLKQIPDILKYHPFSKFMFVGKRINPFYKEVKKLAHELNIYSHVTFIGEKDNALEYLYAADLLVFPSRAEAMPRVILEAMALETCVVSSDVDGIPELIDHEKEGLLFSLQQPEMMSKAVASILENSTIQEQFVSNGYQKYWSNFSREAHVKNYNNLMSQIISKNNG